MPTDLARLRRIKKLVAIALVSDDDLLEQFVLKGGNALDLIYEIAPRASMDLDYSIATTLEQWDMDALQKKIEASLARVLDESGYDVLDVSIGERPEVAGASIPSFWGGYELKFKIVKQGKIHGRALDARSLRMNAEVIGLGSKRNFKVDISKCEYCEPKTIRDLDGYAVYVYTPEMIAIEKLRAICQQTEEYCTLIGRTHRTARARDFFDIHTVAEHFQMDLYSAENTSLLRNIFAAKGVPLNLLCVIERYREFHRPDFVGVLETLKPEESAKEFDYYFDYVLAKSGQLSHALGIV